MMLLATLEELVDFVVAKRKGAAFRDWPYAMIATGIYQAAESNTLAYHRDSNNKLDGIVIARRDDLKRNIHVINILTTNPGVIELMALQFVTLFPNYTLTAYRRGKLITYDTVKIIAKILHKGVK